ncbi:hypothetical protein [Azorhizobium sp. AG788]|uniref:hypothetical protein n=1 Tax=Azorhizobium sp. AG788 TaxID=2183897 RepID=UPI003139CA73
MITHIIRAAPAPSTAIAITYADGSRWFDDLALPADTAIRRARDEWLAAGGEVAPYVAPPLPPPAEISDRQFFQGLALRGLVSQAEALAAVGTGTLPAAFEALIGQLSAEDQFAARMLLSGATSFQRTNPLVDTLGAMLDMSPAEIDDLWRFCAGL